MHEFKIGRLRGECVVTWWAGGKRRRYRLGTHDAKEAERKALDVIRREAMKTEGGTWATLWGQYREEKSGRRVAEAMRHESKAVLGHFGHLRPDQTTIAHSRAYTALRRSQGKHDGTIWTELGHLRTVGTWALKRRLITHAPVIERPAKPAPKDRYLTAAEIQQLLEAPMAEHIRLAILLMLGTAGRVTAVLELTWDRVNFDAGSIDLRLDTKGPRKGRATLPMSAGLRAALSSARRAALTDHVIEWAGQPVRSIRTGFNAAVKAAGLEGVTPHVLRHTAGVHLAAGGMPMTRIAQYLGHSSTAVTERVYARYAPDHLREEAALLDFSTTRAVKGQVR
jgi:integrase